MKRQKKLEAPFFQFETDFFAKIGEGIWEWQGPETVFDKLPLPELKMQNAATSLMTLHCLQERLPLSLDAIRNGINKAALPGRFECVQKPALIIFDVAHNPQATRYLAEKLQQTAHASRKTLAVVGMLQDKDIRGTFESMLSCVDQWYIGGLKEEARGATSENLMEVLVECQGSSAKTCYDFVSVTEAFEGALNDCGSQDRIIVFGSFHTVGLVKQYLLEKL